MSEWVLEVSEVNEYVRQLLQNEPALRKVRLRGEISNFKRHSSGHWYFTLKDERCRIAAVMFRQNAMRMSIRPMDGMSVIVSGQVGLYSEGGSYQITCDSMRPDGIGTLYQQFEALKNRLAAEGLFDEEHKRRLPVSPEENRGRHVGNRRGAARYLHGVAGARSPRAAGAGAGSGAGRRGGGEHRAGHSARGENPGGRGRHRRARRRLDGGFVGVQRGNCGARRFMTARFPSSARLGMKPTSRLRILWRTGAPLRRQTRRKWRYRTCGRFSRGWMECGSTCRRRFRSTCRKRVWR